MIILNIALVLFTVLCIIWLAKRTKIIRSRPQRYVEPLPYKPLALNEVKELYTDGELLCRAGYMHYHLDIANTIAEDEEGLFVGYATADPQHVGRICIYDLQHIERGHIDNQTDLYRSLSTRKQAAVYGFLLHNEAKGYYGEVCVKVR
ncbi:hypothetical protein [Prevotella falsenii]|uniref:hypothetical protein n=1 Tax=Prevotella falsenii TaxID=515414 RepID=UPI00046AD0B3|nr:hypothetical protein [Prevotella falsenii]